MSTTSSHFSICTMKDRVSRKLKTGNFGAVFKRKNNTYEQLIDVLPDAKKAKVKPILDDVATEMAKVKPVDTYKHALEAKQFVQRRVKNDVIEHDDNEEKPPPSRRISTQNDNKVRPIDVPETSNRPVDHSPTSPDEWAGDMSGFIPSDSNLPANTHMDEKEPNVEAAAKADGPTVGNVGNHDTAVDFNVPKELGFFTETRTAILPVTFYLSMQNLDKISPVFLRIRLNDFHNILKDNTLAIQTIGQPRVKGVSNNLCAANYGTTDTKILGDNNFPSSVIGATAQTATTTSGGTVPNTSLYPAWAPYYERIYESYHVMKTEYAVYMEALNNFTNNSDTLMFYEYDAYTGNSAGNVIPSTSQLQDLMIYKRMKYKRFGCCYTVGQQQSNYRDGFSGTWYPNQIMKNTRNDEDIKTWYPTGAEPSPTWVEQLVLMGMLDPFTFGWNNGSVNREAGFNIRIDLKYHVQFKDLKQIYRYPQRTDSQVNALIVPNDVYQRPWSVEQVGV